MKKLWRKNAVAIVVGGYLLGFVSLPGLFWYRTCDLETPSERMTCTAYLTLAWPVVLPGLGMFWIAKEVFQSWKPLQLSQNQG